MSIQQGLSGLSSSSKLLEAIGNNVANASTVGFKQSQVQFADMFAASLTGAAGLQTGTGGRVSTIAQEFTQGVITNTTNPLDVAINGKGFFQVDDGSGTPKYSRNGQFQVDMNGFIVNAQGAKITGNMATNGLITKSTTPVPLQISTAKMPAKPTSVMTVAANLDSRLPSIPLSAANPLNTVPIFNPADPTTYNNSTAVNVFDAAGNSHVGSIYYQRVPNSLALAGLGGVVTAGFAVAGSTMTVGSTSMLTIGDTITHANGTVYTVTGVIDGTQVTVTPPSAAADTVLGVFTPLAPAAVNAKSNDWNVYMTVDGQLVTPVPVPPAVLPAAQAALVAAAGSLPIGAIPPNPTVTIQFSAAGLVTSPLTTTSMTAAVPTFNAAGVAVGTGTLPFSLSFGSMAAGSTPTTQYGAAFGINASTQDGNASGDLNRYTIGADGIIQGQYSNGITRSLGQITLANFANPQGLQPVGNNEWISSTTSGAALFGGVPSTNGLGALQASAVEASNVDLTAELVNMITAQRVYQANAQTIKTQDQLLQTIVNIK